MIITAMRGKRKLWRKRGFLNMQIFFVGEIYLRGHVITKNMMIYQRLNSEHCMYNTKKTDFSNATLKSIFHLCKKSPILETF